MAFSQRFLVRFDDGTEIEAQASSRDMVALEKAGVNLTGLPPISASYQIAHAALLRMGRVGRLPDGVEIPAKWEQLADLADLEPVQADAVDPEGNGSGQVPTPG